MHTAIKVGRVILGFLLLAAGLLLSVPGVPGPGFAVIILGLVLLSAHFRWARRMLDWAKAKYEQIKQRAGFGKSRDDEEQARSGGAPGA